MRIYMLPLTITATLMSASAVQADRIHHYKLHTAAQMQANVKAPSSTVSKGRPEESAEAL